MPLLAAREQASLPLGEGGVRARGRLARQWLLRCLHWLMGPVFLQPLGLQEGGSSPFASGGTDKGGGAAAAAAGDRSRPVGAGVAGERGRVYRRGSHPFLCLLQQPLHPSEM